MNPDPIASMDEEILKGASSEAPEETMAAISGLKDYLSGKDPSREAFGEAVSEDLGSIKARKADLFRKLASGEELSSSQTVGLGVLALGLMAAGGLIKGKRGIGMGGQAFNLGGQIYMKQNEARSEANKKAVAAELSSLNSQEKDLVKQGVENKMAPVKNEESIGAKLEARRRMVKEGLVNPNGMTINLEPGTKAVERLEAAREAKIKLSRMEAKLQKNFPTEMKEGESWLQAATRMASGVVASEGVQKDLEADIQGIIRANAKSLGANPSNQDVARIAKEITGGNVYSIPFLASRLSSMSVDIEDRIESILSTGKILNEGGGYNTSIDSILAGTNKAEPKSPDMQKAPPSQTTPIPHVQNGKRGVLVDGVFRPFKKQG